MNLLSRFSKFPQETNGGFDLKVKVIRQFFRNLCLIQFGLNQFLERFRMKSIIVKLVWHEKALPLQKYF
jgi:hypothetical protein